MTAGVVTGEAVALDVRLAHWPSRMLAFFIDVAAQAVCWVLLNLALMAAMTDVDADLAAAIGISAMVIVWVGYPLAFETLWRGRSPGKAALGLRVVRDDGGPERFRHAVARSFLMPLEFWGPALISSVVNRRAKRLGDLLAGTIVVRQRVPGRTSLPVAMPPPLAMWAGTLDLSRLPDDLALACRQFLARQHELKPGPRDAMGAQLVAAVQAAVTPPPPPGTPGWAYLSAVLAERRRREEWRLHAAAQRPAFGQPAGRPGYAPPAYGSMPGYGAAPGYGSMPRYGAVPGYGAALGYGAVPAAPPPSNGEPVNGARPAAPPSAPPPAAPPSAPPAAPPSAPQPGPFTPPA